MDHLRADKSSKASSGSDWIDDAPMQPDVPNPANDSAGQTGPAFPASPPEAWPFVAQDSYTEVADMLIRFRRRSPVRHIAEALIHGTYRPLDSVQPLFTALANSDRDLWHERVVAAWALGRVGLSPIEQDAAVAGLVGIIDTPAAGSLKQRAIRGLGWGLRAAVALSLFTIIINHSSHHIPWPVALLQCMTVFGAGGCAVAVPLSLFFGRMATARDYRLQAAAAESLGRLNSSESIGPLTELLFSTNRSVAEAASSALHNLLPQLTDEDYGRFDPGVIRNLARGLSHPDNLLVNKVLEALEKVGSAHAAPQVRRISLQGKTRRLRDRAGQVLDALEERGRQSNHALELMRGAAAPLSTNEHLLRPARHAGETDPLQLLRPGQGDVER